jgi:hypothetical protein
MKRQELQSSLDDILGCLSPNSKIGRKELKNFLMMVALDYQTKPPTEDQVEIIHTLLNRNSSIIGR